MKFMKSINAIDTHTVGEPTRIIVNGTPKIIGNTMSEKKDYIAKNMDYIRTSTMLEPRGHKDMFGCIITEPTMPEADIGVVFMDGTGYMNMCGHSIIGVATVAVETGIVDVREPYTEIKIESPAGLVTAKVKVENGKAKEVSFVNVPSFIYKRNVKIDLADVGTIAFNIVFAGNFIAVINAEEVGIKINKKNIGKLIEKAMILLKLINEKIPVEHSEKKHIKSVDSIEFYGPPKTSEANSQSVVIFGAGQFDRSPCGTGTCAKIAMIYEQGELKVGETFVNESITGTTFKGKIIEETKVGEHNAIVVEITGSAYIIGFNQLVIDEEDPVKFGFQTE